MEAVRALTESPQAWSFKESLAIVGGDTIPSRIADALSGPLRRLEFHVDSFINPSQVNVHAHDDLDSSLHVSRHSSPAGKLSHTPPGPAKNPGKSSSVEPCIGEGDISWGPLCRACVRLGRYMVHRPSHNENIAADDKKIHALLDSIKGITQFLHHELVP